MISSTALLGLFVVVLFGIWTYFFKAEKGNYPPGPRPWPIVGNILLIDSLAFHPFDAFTKLATKYGPIFSVRLASNRAVILNDYKLIRAAFNEASFSGRPDNKVFNFHANGKNGVLCSDGQIWTEQRRFTLRHLRDFGFGKRNMETLIVDEVTELVETFKRQEGQPIEPRRLFSLAILNSLWIIVSGQRFNQDDPELNTILKDFFKQIDEVSSSGLVTFIPALSYLAPEWSGWNNLIRATKKTTDLFRTTVVEHARTRTAGSPRDFIDTHLDEIERTEDPGSSFYKDVGHQQLIAVIGDLFAAGAETTATTLNWAVLYLSKFPEVRRKFTQEIDGVVGASRLPCLADRANMPYTEALMSEVLRKSSIVSLGLFHCTTADTKFAGYDIPKDTYVVANLYHAHNNSETWGDPQHFRPERFLSADGHSVQKHEALMPFSTGKRQCLGETLARDSFFLFLTALYQRFDVQLEEKFRDMSLAPTKTFLLSPEPYSVIMKDRQA